jgi:hypothetical protein
LSDLLAARISNPIVRAAIEALQRGDRDAWSALFERHAQLFDDGTARSLDEFNREALGHERFTSLERIERGGLELEGGFHSDQWGDFRTVFRFTLSSAGKIIRLDSGQA